LACRWRIRHKLILGLTVVVAIMGVLLFGTLKGLESYKVTMNLFDSELQQLNLLGSLKEIQQQLPPGDAPLARPRDVRTQIALAQKKLEEFDGRLQEALDRRLDPKQQFYSRQFVSAFGSKLTTLDKALENMESSERIKDALDLYGKVRAELPADLDLEANTIYHDLYERKDKAVSDFRTSLTIVLSTTILSVLLMTGLLHFFYRWTFYPLRDLGLGVGRVARGDFDHTIEVHSGDEMEELAAAFNDMTGRLRDMYRDLARQVNERSRQLVRSERLAGVGFLAAGVAHEINNPLASIAFCGEALEARLTDLLGSLPRDRQTDREVIARYLKMIQEEAFRCKDITGRLLEFSRGGERRREPTNLAEVIHSVLDIAQHLQNAKNKEIRFNDPGQPLIAEVNAQEVKSVVLNLVVNALESMDDGGSLTISLGLHDGLSEMVFKDTGCGMSAEILENIFEPFYTRSRTGKGTGLGLSISHRIVNQHGGEIEATSAGPGQGSTFTVRIPLRPATNEQEDTPPPLRLAA
jgi:signal transduction histidine kinase